MTSGTDSEMSDHELVETLLKLDGQSLTAWERDFIESLESQVGSDRDLTDEQRQTAEKILVERG